MTCVSENSQCCNLSVPKSGLGNSKKLLNIVDEQNLRGLYTGDEGTHLLVLKTSFTRALSVPYIWWLDLGYPCVGKDVHRTNADCSSHLLGQ